MTLFDQKYRAVYYGTTQKGHRIHLADALFYQTSTGEYWAKSYCGNNITTFESGKAPYRVNEFCHSCFRTMAWEIFEDYMLQFEPLLQRVETS